MSFVKAKKAVIVGLSSLFILANTQVAFAASRGKVSGIDLNLVEEASPNATVVQTLNKDDEVTVIKAINSSWLLLETENGQVYAKKDLVELTSVEVTANIDNVNIRSAPNLESEVYGKLNKGDKVHVQAKDNRWLEITYNGNKAYVFAQYFDSDLVEALEVNAIELYTYATVDSPTGLKLRAKNSTESAVLSNLTDGQELEVLELGEEWIKVKTKDNMEGYVKSEYLVIVQSDKPPVAPIEAVGIEMVEYAKQFLGTPYSWGGTDLKRGVDCSGFVYAVYRDFGISLNRVAADMVANGSKVERSEIIAGDLVFFNTGGYGISHVGIYMGDGQFIHSSSGSAYSVVISSLNEGYYNTRYVSSVRVLK